MQENKIKNTIETLVALGQYNALKALADSLRADYELAVEALRSFSDNYKTEEYPIKQNVLKSNTGEIKYNKDWKLPEKFLYVLNRESRFLKFREAAKMIVELDGNGDVNKITRKLTGTTNRLKADKKIVKIIHNNKFIDTFWGSPKWLDDNGDVKREFMYDLDALKVKNSNTDSSLFDNI